MHTLSVWKIYYLSSLCTAWYSFMGASLHGGTSHFYRNLLCNVLFVNYTVWLLRLNTYSLIFCNTNMYGSCAEYFSISSYFLSALSFLAVSCTAAKSLLTKHHSTILVKIRIWEMADICSTKFNVESSDNCFCLPFMCGV